MVETRKKLTRIVFGGGVGEKPCEGERGGEENPRDEGNRGRAGSNETSIRSMIKRKKRRRTTTAYREAKTPRTAFKASMYSIYTVSGVEGLN